MALIALYHNTRPLQQRGYQTPLQLAGVDLGGDGRAHLIEHEMRYGQAEDHLAFRAHFRIHPESETIERRVIPA